MIILPAIDIMDGTPVRLYQGSFEKKTIVAKSVIDTARMFEEKGASWIHMVDLDGAKNGSLMNSTIIQDAAKNVSIPVEVGGGIRDMDSIDCYLNNGISRVILGTAAIEDFDFVKRAVAKYKEKIAVGIDCKDGYASGSGWLIDSKIQFLDLAKEMEKIGVQTVIVTDIAKDGTLQGPNYEMYEKLIQKTNLNVIASGGIANLENIRELKKRNLYGAITGKAIYSGSLNLVEAIQEGERTC